MFSPCSSTRSCVRRGKSAGKEAGANRKKLENVSKRQEGRWLMEGVTDEQISEVTGEVGDREAPNVSGRIFCYKVVICECKLS